VLRDRDGMAGLQRTLDQAPPAAGPPDGSPGGPPGGPHPAHEPARHEPPAQRLDLASVEATNLHAASVLVTMAALARAESRGCHRWRDIPPVTSAGRARHTVLRLDGDQVRVAAGTAIAEGVAV
jgi:hypothetical protein